LGLMAVCDPHALASWNQRTTTASWSEVSESREPTTEQNATPDFSVFSHTSSAHARLRCTACHRRGNDSRQSIRPGHTPCSSCHSQKFAVMKGPICTVCHNSEEPKNGAVKSFSGLRGFGVKFDHAIHVSAGCATCHRSTNRGVALTIPSRENAHSTCNQCHGPGVQKEGRDLSSCDVCHTRGPYQRPSISAKAYKINFSHAEHGIRQKLNCTDCHRTRAGASLRRSMSQPIPAMHHASGNAQSCMSCHNNKRAFGGDDFTDCKRCHQGSTFRF
jgi:c(7)-type cytochrome triheme protein